MKECRTNENNAWTKPHIFHHNPRRWILRTCESEREGRSGDTRGTCGNTLVSSSDLARLDIAWLARWANTCKSSILTTQQNEAYLCSTAVAIVAPAPDRLSEPWRQSSWRRLPIVDLDSRLVSVLWRTKTLSRVYLFLHFWEYLLCIIIACIREFDLQMKWLSLQIAPDPYLITSSSLIFTVFTNTPDWLRYTDIFTIYRSVNRNRTGLPIGQPTPIR